MTNEVESKATLNKRKKQRKIVAGISIPVLLAAMIYLGINYLLVIQRGDPNSVNLLVRNNNGNPEYEVVHGLIVTNFLNSVYSFPLASKSYVLSKTDTSDQSVNFITSDGIRMSVDLFIEIEVLPDQIPEMFKIYGKTLDDFFYQHLSRDIRSSFIQFAATLTADSIIANQNLFVQSVSNMLKSKYSEKYVKINNLGLEEPIKLPDELMKLINQNVFKKQFALDAKYTQEQAEAQSATSVALNKMRLDSVITQNKIKLYNQMVNNELRIDQYKTDSAIYSLEFTPEKLKFLELKNMEKAIDKWDGHLPENTNKFNLPFRVDTE